MSRPRVIEELSGYLASLLRSRLREDEAADGIFPVYWGHPRDFDRHSELGQVSPIVGLCLLEVFPDARAPCPHPRSVLSLSERVSNEAVVKRAPYWMTCRYLLSIRSENPVEEQGLVAAGLQVLLDQPVVPLSAFDSLKSEPGMEGAISGFPIVVQHLPEIWKDIGMTAHRLIIPFDVTVPLLSSTEWTAVRVTERKFDFDGEAGNDMATDDAGRGAS